MFKKIQKKILVNNPLNTKAVQTCKITNYINTRKRHFFTCRLGGLGSNSTQRIVRSRFTPITNKIRSQTTCTSTHKINTHGGVILKDQETAQNALSDPDPSTSLPVGSMNLTCKHCMFLGDLGGPGSNSTQHAVRSRLTPITIRPPNKHGMFENTNRYSSPTH